MAQTRKLEGIKKTIEYKDVKEPRQATLKE